MESFYDDCGRRYGERGSLVMFGKEKKMMRGKNLYLPHIEQIIRRELKFRLQLLATPRL